jgi:hypothetical protein
MFTTFCQAVPVLLQLSSEFCLVKKLALNTLLPIVLILVNMEERELHEFDIQFDIQKKKELHDFNTKFLLFRHIRCNKACWRVKFSDCKT